MATSVPVPMAMPRSAWARAGASLTPSPTMATRGRRCLQASATSAALSPGRTSATTWSMPTSRAMRGGGAPVVAGDHDDVDAERAECCDAWPSRLRADGVGDGEHAGDRAVPADEDDGAARRLRVGSATALGASVDRDADRGEQAPACRRSTVRPSTVAWTPRPAVARKSTPRPGRPSGRGGGDDGPADRDARTPASAAAASVSSVVAVAPADGYDVGDRHAARR